jgi:hypothetical protein
MTSRIAAAVRNRLSQRFPVSGAAAAASPANREVATVFKVKNPSRIGLMYLSIEIMSIAFADEVIR